MVTRERHFARAPLARLDDEPEVEIHSVTTLCSATPYPLTLVDIGEHGVKMLSDFQDDDLSRKEQLLCKTGNEKKQTFALSANQPTCCLLLGNKSEVLVKQVNAGETSAREATEALLSSKPSPWRPEEGITDENKANNALGERGVSVPGSESAGGTNGGEPVESELLFVDEEYLFDNWRVRETMKTNMNSPEILQKSVETEQFTLEKPPKTEHVQVKQKLEYPELVGSTSNNCNKNLSQRVKINSTTDSAASVSANTCNELEDKGPDYTDPVLQRMTSAKEAQKSSDGASGHTNSDEQCQSRVCEDLQKPEYRKTQWEEGLKVKDATHAVPCFVVRRHRNRRPWRWRLTRKRLMSFIFKYCLFVINFFFWVTSVVAIVIGAWVLKERGQLVRDSASFYLDPSAMLCSVGAVAFLVAFVGCLGALRENICLLKTFQVSMIVVLLFEATIGAVVFIFYAMPQVRQHIKAGAEGVIKMAVRLYHDDVELQLWIDLIQKELKCCGASNTDAGYLDWKENPYFNCTPYNPSVERCAVPRSCCIIERGDYINDMCGFDTTNKEVRPS
ncbi:hypothetical protein C0Q70_09031 [Pomacea canaliculata]|uniref:Uncharacterized protein n=1 Tax=Pomacea canaliculata TaxID=400727 RepID=A0A2T7P8N1_POMCA|nr:hypothetical protein C0Q70_09031 [Pomacea canaliculata]